MARTAPRLRGLALLLLASLAAGSSTEEPATGEISAADERAALDFATEPAPEPAEVGTDAGMCFLFNGLPPTGPVEAYDLTKFKNHDERDEWLALNRAYPNNGPGCKPQYAMPYCQLLDKDWYSYVVQGLLLVLGFGSLVLKKWREDRFAAGVLGLEPRPTNVWALDVSKQAFSGICAHLLGMLNAHTLQNKVWDTAGTSECSWYLVAFTLDTTIGVMLGYLLVSLCGTIGKRSAVFGALKETGNYYRPGGDGELDYWIWAQQLFVWGLITVFARMAVLGVMLLLNNPLASISALIAREFACSPRMLLTLVMVMGPLVMNVIQLWVQDQFLKNAPPEVPASEAAGEPGWSSTADEEGGHAPRVSQPGVELIQPLISTAVHPAGSTNGGGRGRGGSDAPPVTPDTDMAKSLRKTCCSYLLKFLGCAIVFSALAYFTGALAADQYYYDHCYNQVQLEARFLTPVGRTAPYDAGDWDPVPSCKSEVLTNTEQERKTNLKWQTEHRLELFELAKNARDPMEDMYRPKCRCCNDQRLNPAIDTFSTEVSTTYKPEGWCSLKEDESGTQIGIQCPDDFGQCCGRSTITSPDPALQQACQICDVYLPCDTTRCPARPDYIHNTQHYPLLAGVTLSMLSNTYVVYTWAFNSKLRRPTITSLIALAAIIEMVFCIALILQEVSFRVPNSPCIEETRASSFGNDVFFPPCDPISAFHGWPTWASVDAANQAELSFRTKPEVKERPAAGQRGAAVNGCQAMSFIFQLTWTASDSVYFMVTIDLLANLYTSPFGSTTKRWIFYHGWTWTISITFAILLMVSGDWGVSQESLLEDFCWHVSFGHHTLTNVDKQLEDQGKTKSNWPWWQWLVYGTSLFYYVTSLCIAAFAQWKIRRGNLPEGLKQARLKSIEIGTKVTAFCAGWLLAGFVFYWCVMEYSNNQKITRLDTLRLGLRDYEQDCRLIVVIWAFVWGARNVVNFLVWRIVVQPQYDPTFGEIVLIPSVVTVTLQAPPPQTRELIRRIIDAEITSAPRQSMALAASQAREDREGTLQNMSRSDPEGLRKLGESLGVQESANLELNEVLRNELLFFAGLGIRSALRYPNHEHEDSYGMRGSMRGSRGGSQMRDTGGRASRSTQGELRQVAKINLAHAEHWEKTGGDTSGPTKFSQEVEKVFTGNDPRLSRMSDGRSVQLSEEERVALHRANNERIGHLRSFKFKTYEPRKFKRLRELFGIDTRGGRGGEDSELHKSMESFKVANFTGGASGAFMYFSADKRFIVKQIDHKEMSRMLKMMDDYIQHLEQSRENMGRDPTTREVRYGPPRSLLQRVVQCHRITMSQHAAQQCCGIRSGSLYFMVMENCLYSRITRQMSSLHKIKTNNTLDENTDEATKETLLKELERNDSAHQRFFVYDLKGSRQGRSTLLDNGPSQHTMKDNDLREDVHMSTRDREVVVKYLEKDSEFLCKQQVMDYSLLLGVQKGLRATQQAGANGHPAEAGNSATDFAQYAEAAKVDGAETFYVGIIDFLQDWDGSKRAERWGKVVCYGYDPDDISAMDPQKYQKRFLHRLKQRFPENDEDVAGGEPEPEPEAVAPAPMGVSRPASPSSRQSSRRSRARVSQLAGNE